MGPWIPALISSIGSIFTGWFGTKQSGIEAVSGGAQAAIGVINNSIVSDAQKEQAIAQVVAADSGSESFLARNWRPAVACVLWGMVFAMFLGYNPTAFNEALTPTKEFIFETAKGCLFGYMPLRSVDKWISAAYKAKIFDKIISSLTHIK